MGKCIGVPAVGHGGGVSSLVRSIPHLAAVSLAALALCGGCQSAEPIKTYRLIEHQALIDFSGLKPAGEIPELKVHAASPRSWEVLPPTKAAALYTHHQWRSPSSRTAVGAAYVRLPLPLGAKAVLWLAKREYANKSADGRLIAEWTDELGRNWFEAENAKYHVRGYCLAQGFEAWVVYWGYRTTQPPEPTEISLAARCADTFVPLVGGGAKRPLPDKAPTTAPATQPAGGR